MKNPSAKAASGDEHRFRGPGFHHFPNNAADSPSITIASEKINATSDWVQSSGPGLAMPTNCVSGILKTLNEYT
jgi:hypothetical protein